MRVPTPSRVLWVGLCAFALGGCESKGKPAETDLGLAGDKPATTVGAFQEASVRQALQGRWSVHDGNKQIWAFEIEGDRAVATDMRFASPKSEEGKLVVRSATSFGVEAGDGVTYYYSYAKVGDAVHMGMGTAIRMGEARAVDAKLGAWERLIRTGETCKYVKSFGGEAAERSVPCGFEKAKGGGGEVFHYMAEDSFHRERMKRYELHVRGDYLLDDEMLTSVAKPGSAPKSAAAESPPD